MIVGFIFFIGICAGIYESISIKKEKKEMADRRKLINNYYKDNNISPVPDPCQDNDRPYIPSYLLSVSSQNPPASTIPYTPPASPYTPSTSATPYTSPFAPPASATPYAPPTSPYTPYTSAAPYTSPSAPPSAYFNSTTSNPPPYTSSNSTSPYSNYTPDKKSNMN